MALTNDQIQYVNVDLRDFNNALIAVYEQAQKILAYDRANGLGAALNANPGDILGTDANNKKLATSNSALGSMYRATDLVTLLEQDAPTFASGGGAFGRINTLYNLT